MMALGKERTHMAKLLQATMLQFNNFLTAEIIKKQLILMASLLIIFFVLPQYIFAQEDESFEKIFYYSTGRAGIKSLQD